MPVADLVCDLDGTLVDSRPGIDAAAARAVAAVWPGRAPRSLAPFIGPPVGTMLRAAWPEASEAEVDALVRAFREAYDGEAWRRTLAFPGAAEALAGAARAFVVTNKPHLATRRILEHLGLAEHLVESVSPDTPGGGFATKAEALGELRRRYTLDPARSAYVGDAEEDRVAARLSGLPFVAVSYGYGAAGAHPAPTDLAVLPTPDLLPSLVRKP